MRTSLLLISTLFLLTACVDKSSLKIVFPEYSLNANSAKSWYLTHSSDPNDPFFTELKEYRTSFTFFYNQKFIQQEYIHLGSENGAFGKYETKRLADEAFLLKLYYSINNSVEKYEVMFISDRKLVLKNQDTGTIWEFKSLTPPL